MSYRIERKYPPKGAPSHPYLTPRGYKLADPCNGAERHHAKHAIYMPTLDEVVDALRKGWLLWMKQEGKRPTLICASSLLVSS